MSLAKLTLIMHCSEGQAVAGMDSLVQPEPAPDTWPAELERITKSVRRRSCQPCPQM